MVAIRQQRHFSGRLSWLLYYVSGRQCASKPRTSPRACEQPSPAIMPPRVPAPVPALHRWLDDSHAEPLRVWGGHNGGRQTSESKKCMTHTHTRAHTHTHTHTTRTARQHNAPRAPCLTAQTNAQQLHKREPHRRLVVWRISHNNAAARQVCVVCASHRFSPMHPHTVCWFSPHDNQQAHTHTHTRAHGPQTHTHTFTHIHTHARPPTRVGGVQSWWAHHDRAPKLVIQGAPTPASRDSCQGCCKRVL
jgi:hypothetical protein